MPINIRFAAGAADVCDVVVNCLAAGLYFRWISDKQPEIVLAHECHQDGSTPD
jgi:hypothetical protein